MNDFIFNILSAQGPIIPMWLPIVGGFPINSPLVGSFLGVFLAFSINYIYKSSQDYKSKVYYKNNFKLEIEFCIERLERVGNLLPLDRWTATLSSGALRFFNVGEVDKLSRAYEAIRNYNYEAKRTRDLGEDYRKYSSILGGPDADEAIELGSRWRKGSERLELMQKELLKSLNELLPFLK